MMAKAGGDSNSEVTPPCTYSLRAVIVHMGTAQMGHYISYCKLRRPSADQGSSPSSPQSTGSGGSEGDLRESPVTSSMFAVTGDKRVDKDGQTSKGVGGSAERSSEAPTGSDSDLQWYCFDDDHVYPVSKEEAVDGNFGSGGGGGAEEAAGLFGSSGVLGRRMIERMKASR